MGKLASLELQKFRKRLLNSGRVNRGKSKSQPCQDGQKPPPDYDLSYEADKRVGINFRWPSLELRHAQGEVQGDDTPPVEQLGYFLRKARDIGVFELYSWSWPPEYGEVNF